MRGQLNEVKLENIGLFMYLTDSYKFVFRRTHELSGRNCLLRYQSAEV